MRGNRAIFIKQGVQTRIALEQVAPDTGPFRRVQIVDREAVDVALRKVCGHSCSVVSQQGETYHPLFWALNPK